MSLPSSVAIFWKNREGFSLVEIVMALGIISFAIIGIMGLFPVAMRTAVESQRETRATYIARQIFSDLESLPASNTFLATTPDVLDPGLAVDLTKDGSLSVNFDAEGIPTTAPGDVFYVATIAVKANSPTPGLSSIQTSVRPTAASTNSSPYIFSTILRH